MTTSQTAFEVEYLRQLSMQLSLASCTFESQAEVYTAVHAHEDCARLSGYEDKFCRGSGEENWRLNVRRLEDAWFTYQLVLFFEHHNQLNDVSFGSGAPPSNRRDIESLCELAALHLSKITPKWISHVCNVKGCREGVVTVDGNEKVNRAMCAAPKSKVAIDRSRINMVQCCPRSPITGGKHQRASKYCQHHDSLSRLPGTQDIVIPYPNLHTPQLDRTAVGDVPDIDSDDLLVGCKKSKNVNKFFDRTAGVAAMVRPCGIVVNYTEMFTCESPTQMYLFLVFTFARGRDFDRLRYVAYDRACDLHPFLKNLEKKGAYFARHLLRNVKFLVDIWHVDKHSEPCCQPPGPLNPNCKYHPQHPDFHEISGCNTECAEQAFKWLNSYKKILKRMKRHRFNFFMYLMIDLHNQHRERQLRSKGAM